MKNKIILTIIILLPFSFISAQTISEKLSGKIVLSVEENGEAWYINPENLKRYYLGRPTDAFKVMRELSLGITNDDFDTISNITPARFAGRILLKVEDVGKAYYVNPDDMKMYYLARPADAFRIMRELGLGITKEDLFLIKEFSENEITSSNINYSVPFTSQAPTAEWSDSIFQDGCEEASSLMAVYWAQNKKFLNISTREMIVNISDWEKERFGEFRDISTEDTATMIREYFNYDNVEVLEIGSINELIDNLKKGVVIVPANGKKLGNINFTPPGPINHMLVITGYTYSDKIFTTNDPGTRNGKGYKYDEDILFEAIRDYPTGYHLPNNEIVKKIILIKK